MSLEDKEGMLGAKQVNFLQTLPVSSSSNHSHLTKNVFFCPCLFRIYLLFWYLYPFVTWGPFSMSV
jgi:hypothetical protein